MMLFKLGQPDPTRAIAPPDFWDQMIVTLFENVLELHEQIQTFFPDRLPGDGSPPIMVSLVTNYNSTGCHQAHQTRYSVYTYVEHLPRIYGCGRIVSHLLALSRG